jgi:hypothetical protein
MSVAVRSEAKLSLTKTESRASWLRPAGETRHKQKKGISDKKTIRRVNIYLVRRPEASVYQPVDVVSPIDATGYP